MTSISALVGKETPRTLNDTSSLKIATNNGILPLPEELKSFAITTKEDELIQQLRTRLGPLATPRYTDVRICRFLRARDHKLDQAEEMLRKEMKWRQETNPEKIASEFLNDEHGRKIHAYWPGDLHGVDKWGCPINVERLAAIDTVSLFNNSHHDILIRFHIFCMERNDRIFSAIWEQYRAPFGYVHIDDLEGLGMKHYNSQVVGTLKEISKIDDNYYPETLRKFIIVNAPSAFKFFWQIAKAILNKNTIKKFEVCKGSYEKEVSKVATKDNLPQFLGGTCTTCAHVSTQCKYGGGKLTCDS